MNKKQVLAKNAAWWSAHPEKSRAKNKRYRAENAAKVQAYSKRYKSRTDVKNRDRERSLRKNYGLTLSEYSGMAQAQRGLCAICSRRAKCLCVDHNHSTGKVRALLCKKCNFAVGLLDDSSDLAIKVSEYLKKHI